MSTDTSTLKSFLSTPRLLLAAVLLIVLALLIASLPSVRFFTQTFEQTMFTTAEFDANNEVTIDLPDDRTRYILAAVVDDPQEQPPATELTIRTPKGEDVEHWESNGWMSKFGDHYRRIAQFRAPESKQVVITAVSGPNEDFVILRQPYDVIDYNLSVVRPWWIAGAVPFVLGVALIAFVICRKIFQKEDDLRLSL